MGAAVLLDSPVCSECVEQRGLCGRHQCRQAVLPQLAKPAWVRLIGQHLTEQKKRQNVSKHTDAEARSLRKLANKAAKMGKAYAAIALSVQAVAPSGSSTRPKSIRFYGK